MSEPQHWCDYCQDAYDEDHSGEDGAHKAGRAYGPTGADLAERSELLDLARSRMVEGVDGRLVDADTSAPLSPGRRRERGAAVLGVTGRGPLRS